MLDAINRNAAGLGFLFTVVVTVIGSTWYLGTTLASKEDVGTLRRTVEALDKNVDTIQETLPHIMSCLIDLQQPVVLADGTLGDRREHWMIPASCDQALLRTAPATQQGD